jgi:hypothetical protein
MQIRVCPQSNRLYGQTRITYELQTDTNHLTSLSHENLYSLLRLTP